MLAWMLESFASLHTALFETLIEPLLYKFHLMGYADLAYDAVEVFLLGIVQIILLYGSLRWLEAWWPAEVWDNRRAVRADVLYTFLHRLGIMPLVIYGVLTPAIDGIEGWLRLYGYIPPELEEVLPGLANYPLVSFFLYLVLIDGAEYWRHRLQHTLRPWWALHSVHHSQRQLSLWSDERNHVLDDVMTSLWGAVLAWIIGVPPEQFVAWIMVTRLIESLSHANVRWSFGTIGSRLLVGPQFHRVHHAMTLGHDGPKHGCNFAALFPLWDILFGTANFTRQFVATGIADQLHGQDYGDTWLRQQWLGCKRLVDSIRRV
jgi:sterol desaturase/sphingolipid hydroxylase (fatty acid hydroxylase superfamily)